LSDVLGSVRVVLHALPRADYLRLHQLAKPFFEGSLDGSDITADSFRSVESVS
jgi:hypothetical protein